MIVGIDLGTTNSPIAIWENGGARLMPNSLGEVLTPPCVSVDEDGAILATQDRRTIADAAAVIRQAVAHFEHHSYLLGKTRC
jgi:molecular chaperone DnaK (HSP70)